MIGYSHQMIRCKPIPKVPQYSITPRSVETDGQHFLIPLDAVDGQLPGCPRHTHRRRIVDDTKHQSRG